MKIDQPQPASWLAIAFAALAGAIFSFSISHSAIAKQEPAPPFEPTLPWMTDLDEALAKSKQTGKPVLVEFR